MFNHIVYLKLRTYFTIAKYKNDVFHYVKHLLSLFIFYIYVCFFHFFSLFRSKQIRYLLKFGTVISSIKSVSNG